MKQSSKTAKYQSGNCILKANEELGPLVLGDCNSAMDKKIHKEFIIQTVISIGQQAMPMKQKLPQNCNHYFYDIHDNKSQKVPSELFDEVSKIIEQGRRKGGVLVHCYAGVSRSSTFVIAYIMQKWNKSYDVAKQEVKSARNCIYPNDGFVHHLKSYDKVLQKREQERLRKLQEEKRLEIEKSLVKSSRKCVRGGVKSADMSPERVKLMEEERKKHTHEIILEPIQMIKEQKEEVSEKAIEKKSEMVCSMKNSPQKMRLDEKKGNLKSALLNRGKMVANERHREEIKLPKVLNKSPYQEHKKDMLNRSTKTNENIQKNAVNETNSKQRTLKISSSFRKAQKYGIQHSQAKKQPVSHQQHRSILRESKSVMSTTKYKTTAYEIDQSLLNEHQKKIKKIYEMKVVVK